jgi:hypothetical protein
MALMQANQIRTSRAALKRRVEAGNVELACELLLARDDRVASMSIGGFLEWLPGVGPIRAVTIMEPAFTWYRTTTPARTIATLDTPTCLRLAAGMRGTRQPRLRLA